MTGRQDGGDPLRAHPETPFTVAAGAGPHAPLVPAGAAGIWIRTTGAQRGTPPVIGVDGAPAVYGWGQALIVVPPGPHYVSAQLGGTSECGYVAAAEAGAVTALDYADSRLGGTAAIGPSGTVGGTGLTGRQMLLFLLGVQAIAVGMTAAAAATDDYGVVVLVLTWLVWTALAAWLVSLPIRRRGRAIRTRQWGPPTAFAPEGLAQAVGVANLRYPPVPEPPEGHGTVMLRVELGQSATVDGRTGLPPAEAWTPAPVLTVDGVPTWTAAGAWAYPLPAGRHVLRLAMPPGPDVGTPAPVDLGVDLAPGTATLYDVEMRPLYKRDADGRVLEGEAFVSAVVRRGRRGTTTRFDISAS